MGRGFHEPLETVYKLLAEGFMGFAMVSESCDLKIPTDPERLSVALNDVASCLIFFLVERKARRIPLAIKDMIKDR